MRETEIEFDYPREAGIWKDEDTRNIVALFNEYVGVAAQISNVM